MSSNHKNDNQSSLEREAMMKRSFSQKIKELRGKRSLEEVATELEITSQTLSRYERDERNPDLYLAKRIADYYGVSLDVLLGDNSINENDDIISLCSLIGISLDSFKKLSYHRNSSMYNRILNDMIERGFLDTIISEIILLDGFSNQLKVMMKKDDLGSDFKEFERARIDGVRYHILHELEKILDNYDFRERDKNEYNEQKDRLAKIQKTLVEQHHKEVLDNVKKGE